MSHKTYVYSWSPKLIEPASTTWIIIIIINVINTPLKVQMRVEHVHSKEEKREKRKMLLDYMVQIILKWLISPLFDWEYNNTSNMNLANKLSERE